MSAIHFTGLGTANSVITVGSGHGSETLLKYGKNPHAIRVVHIKDRFKNLQHTNLHHVTVVTVDYPWQISFIQELTVSSSSRALALASFETNGVSQLDCLRTSILNMLSNKLLPHS